MAVRVERDDRVVSDHPHVQLGAHSLPVYGQPWKRIVKRLARVMDTARDAVDPDAGFDAEAFVGGLGDKLYETLTTFIPNLPEFLPEHEFNGYTSPQAWKEDRYDESNDPSPTFPQFITAFETVVDVNGGKKLIEYLGKVFDPKMLRAEASLFLSEWRERASAGLPNSLGENEASQRSSSIQTAPTEAPQASSSTTEQVAHGSLDFVPGPWVKAAA